MSSDSVSALEALETFAYTPVIITTVVGYDYLLTFSREIDTVWCRPWTWVSTLFVIVRYVGLCWAVTLGLAGSIFVPGPVDVSIAIIGIGDWGYMLFLAAADIVMILRVSAMWNQSKIIWGILLFIYVPQMIITIIWDAVYTNPGTTLAVTVGRVFNFKFCNYSSSIEPFPTYRAIPRFVLGAALLILAVIPPLRQSVEMYKVTKHFHTNRTMELLVREGAVYFVVNMLFNIVNAVDVPIIDFMLFLDALGYSLCCAMMPRFIISIRELYDRDVRERWQGIDTGFGRSFSTGSEGVSTTVLTDVILGEVQVDDVEAIELKEASGKDVWRQV
ncbi:hypothetical protein OG21DRAFT_1500821 [Imleria badia]|nr:hypothetical protein OG21DRAFT_1500821 [Imleria badia]